MWFYSPLPAESGRIDHIGIQDIEHDTLDRIAHSSESQSLVSKSSGRGLTDDSVTGRAEESGITNHKCLKVSANTKRHWEHIPSEHPLVPIWPQHSPEYRIQLQHPQSRD